VVSIVGDDAAQSVTHNQSGLPFSISFRFCIANPANHEYAILKESAVQLTTPEVP
jgi:hypothetical protein